MRSPAPRRRGLPGAAGILLLAGLLLSPAALRGQAQPPAAMNPMARDIVARMLAAGRAEPDPGRRRQVLSDAAQETPRGLYGAILAAIPSPPPGTVEFDAAQAVFTAWAWETPDYAARWAAGSPPGPLRQIALVEAAGRWAAREPAGAASWARSLPAADRDWVLAKADQFMGAAGPGAREAWLRAREGK